MVGLQDGAQLRLGALLGMQQPAPVAGQRAQLGQQRAARRQRSPVRGLVAQGVGQHERVEAVVFAAGGPVGPLAWAAIRDETGWTTCPSACRCSTSSLGSFHRDRQSRPKLAQFLVELDQTGDVMGQAELAASGAGGVDNAQLMRAAPQSIPTNTCCPVCSCVCTSVLYQRCHPTARSAGRSSRCSGHDSHWPVPSPPPPGGDRSARWISKVTLPVPSPGGEGGGRDSPDDRGV
jgi:hypothetical protein